MGQMEVLAARAPGGVVVVSVNYRLNVLGFLAVRELAEEDGWVANQGIADAIAALQWVQKNIGFFGGDKTRVTLMGQSSGGTLIFALFAAPSAAGLFTGAISLSGSPNITMDAMTKQAQDAPIVAAVGCSGPATAAARVACLRNVSADVLGKATPKPSWDTPGIFGWDSDGIPPPQPGGYDYAGIVHVDGQLLTEPFDVALARELVPAALVISNMEAEGDGGGSVVARNQTPAQWNATLHAAFARWPSGAGVAAASAVAEAYRAEALEDPALAYGSISSDYGLTCAAQRLGAAIAATPMHRQKPVYILYNAWQKSNYPSTGQGRWPYHGLDLGEMCNALPSNATDKTITALLQSFVSDFAYGEGVMPSHWNWRPILPGLPVQTLVVAQDGGWPGHGTRAEDDWKRQQCGVLEAHGMGKTYWWCD